MGGRTIKRPEEAAMKRVLAQEQGSVSEVILRLAWQAGLSREELRNLKWSQVSARELRLEERSVPLEGEVAGCLERRGSQYRGREVYVVTGSRGRGQLEPQSISRLARFALDREEVLRGVSLKDLRHDFIVRQLGQHPWPYVARISGMAATTMYTMFSDFMGEAGTESGADARQSTAVEPLAVAAMAVADIPVEKETPQAAAPVVDEFFAWTLVQEEGPTAVGLALWLAWRHCLDGGEILSLTWADVEGDRLRLPDREVVLDPLLKKWLEQLRARRLPGEDPHLLLTPRSHRPYDAARLSRAVRTVFIRHGAEALTFQDFLLAARRHAVDSQVLKALAERGSLTRGDVVALLDTTPAAAYSQLRRLTETGVILRVGGKYYLPGRVVPPEEQYAAVRAYLKTIGVAYLQALADLLKLERRACARVLRRFVQEGKLARRGQMYVLPAVGKGEEEV